MVFSVFFVSNNPAIEVWRGESQSYVFKLFGEEFLTETIPFSCFSTMGPGDQDTTIMDLWNSRDQLKTLLYLPYTRLLNCPFKSCQFVSTIAQESSNICVV